MRNLKTLMIILISILSLGLTSCELEEKGSISLSKTSHTLDFGDEYLLTATLSGVASNSVTWSSSNNDIVTVDPSGVVTAKYAGSADITVTSISDSTVSATCNITVCDALITDIFSADAAALVSGDKLYLYVGHDEQEAGKEGYVMDDWYCYSTTDMETWQSYGEILNLENFSWCDGNAWTSQVAERDGKFYWYVSVAQASSGGMAIGVAVADSPTGPFTDAIGEPLITSSMTSFTNQELWTWDDIDPTILIDNGQAYMYFGNTYPKYVKLNDDMISIYDEDGDGEVTDEIVDINLPTVDGLNFTEALWIHKYNNRYYMTYAAGWEEQLAYSYSDSPTGPWTAGSKITSYAYNSNTSHPSIVEFNNKWYIFNHNGSRPSGGNFRRSVNAHEFNHGSDGSIPFIGPIN